MALALLGIQVGLTCALLFLGLRLLTISTRPYANLEVLRTLREIKSTGWRLERRSWDLEQGKPESL